MSPASYLTAPPRGVPQMLAACDPFGALASRRNREIMVADAACATLRHTDLDPVVRACAHVARAGGLDRAAGAAASESRMAVLATVRGGARARLPLRRCRGAARGGAVAVRSLELVHPRPALAGGAVQRHRLLRASHSRRRRRG